jgi:hypothetical protein
MTQEQLLGVLRHILTVAGGALVTKGYIDEAGLLEGTGLIVSLVGFVWSYLAKRKAA